MVYGIGFKVKQFIGLIVNWLIGLLVKWLKISNFRFNSLRSLSSPPAGGSVQISIRKLCQFLPFIFHATDSDRFFLLTAKCQLPLFISFSHCLLFIVFFRVLSTSVVNLMSSLRDFVFARNILPLRGFLLVLFRGIFYLPLLAR